MPTLLILLFCGVQLVFAQAVTDLDTAIRARVKRFEQTTGGKVSLFAKNLDSGKSYGFRADDRVRTASTIKVPIMVGCFASVAEGSAKWDEMLPLNADDIVSGSGVVRELSPGIRLPMRDLMHMMIVVSDNTATNLILDRITADWVNAQMVKLGLTKTKSLRKVLGDGTKLKSTPSGHSNEGLLEEYKRFGLGVATPKEMVLLLEKLDRGEVVSASASREILEILKRQQYHEGIGRTYKDIETATKPGSLDRLRSDIGIVYHPRGKIAMAITVDDMPGPNYTVDNPGQLLIAELSEMLIDGLGKAK